MELVRKIDLKDKAEQKRNREQIRRILDNADDPTLRLKRDLIQEFIDEVVPKLNENDSIDDAYESFEQIKQEKDFDQFAEAVYVDEPKLKSIAD